MRSLAPLLLVALLTSGCVSLGPMVTVTDAPPPKRQYVTDKSGGDRYPPYLAAEANIYSCRYGIHYQGRDQFSPPKEAIFASLLARNAPWVVDHQVVLERFDVYNNRRLKMLDMGGRAVGGIIGNAIASNAKVNASVFNDRGLVVYSDPSPTPERPQENAVGCDGENEGEYYASQVSGGHDVIVTWLKFTIDDTPYHFKSLYQFQSVHSGDDPKGMVTAIQLTFAEVGRLISPAGTQRVQQAAAAVAPPRAPASPRASRAPANDVPSTPPSVPQPETVRSAVPTPVAAPAANSSAPYSRWQTVGQRTQAPN